MNDLLLRVGEEALKMKLMDASELPDAKEKEAHYGSERAPYGGYVTAFLKVFLRLLRQILHLRRYLPIQDLLPNMPRRNPIGYRGYQIKHPIFYSKDQLLVVP